MLQAKTVRNVFPIIACGMLSVVVAYAGATTFMQAFLDPTAHTESTSSASITFLQERGVLHGAAESLDVRKTVNRAELLKLTLDTVQHQAIQGTDCFEDVADQWFASYACTAKEAGIIESAASFHPEQVVSLAEVAKVLTAAYQLPVIQGKEWFEGPMQTLQELHILPSDIQDPWVKVTRGQLFDMLYALSGDVTADSH